MGLLWSTFRDGFENCVIEGDGGIVYKLARGLFRLNNVSYWDRVKIEVRKFGELDGFVRRSFGVQVPRN